MSSNFTINELVYTQTSSDDIGVKNKKNIANKKGKNRREANIN